MMKTLQSETKNTAKQRGSRFWLGVLILLVGIPLLMYYGYCWGLWGRQSLLLQYLFQCNCPAASEEARYPQQVDVIISSCSQARVRLLPSGHYLYVREEKSEITTAYLLNLQTTEKIEVPDQSFSSFLTDDLWFVEAGIEDFIVDRTTDKQYPIKIFRFWRDNAYVNGEPNLELLVSASQQAEQIFFTQNNDTVIVLMPNFQTNLEQNFTFDRSDIPGGDPNKVEQFLRGNKVVYQTVLANFPDEVVSRDRRFVARPDGIYLVETEQKIVEGYSTSKSYRAYSRKYFAVRGWASDGSGVIYSKLLNPCLVETNFIILDDPVCFIEVSQPVIKLKVPEEYLLSQETP